MNITLFYLVSLAITVFVFIFYIYFKHEYKKEYKKNEDKFLNRHEETRYEHNTNKLKKIFGILSIICIVLFSICNICIFIFKLCVGLDIVIKCYLILLACFTISVIMYLIEETDIEIIRYFDIILAGIFLICIIISIVAIALYILSICNVIVLGNEISIDGTSQRYKEYSYSIEIVELEEIPYTNVSGNRWYIKSAPSIAYYYDVLTESGNKTTKILDGNQYYVEKDEDNKYIDNPHIEVYEIVNKYINLYGKEKEDVVTYEYTICVPENSIYYESKNIGQ